jgi:hypothetical protein
MVKMLSLPSRQHELPVYVPDRQPRFFDEDAPSVSLTFFLLVRMNK